MTACRMPELVAAVKKSSKYRVRTVNLLVHRAPVQHRIVLGGEFAVDDLDEVLDAHRAHQRLGIAGRRAAASGPCDATAREAATAVAVAPTLEARSQVSLSVRAIGDAPTFVLR